MIEHIIARVRAYPAKRGTVGRRIAGDLYAWYLVEGPDGVRPLTVEQADGLGVTRAQLDAEVVVNLWSRVGGVTFHRNNDAEPFSVLTGTQLTAAALLIDELWSEIGADVRGDLIVRVVDHSRLMCAGTEEPEALARLCDGADEQSLLRWDGVAWEPYELGGAVAYAA